MKTYSLPTTRFRVEQETKNWFYIIDDKGVIGQLHTADKTVELFKGQHHSLADLKEIIAVAELAIASEKSL